MGRFAAAGGHVAVVLHDKEHVPVRATCSSKLRKSAGNGDLGSIFPAWSGRNSSLPPLAALPCGITDRSTTSCRACSPLKNSNIAEDSDFVVVVVVVVDVPQEPSRPEATIAADMVTANDLAFKNDKLSCFQKYSPATMARRQIKELN
jgi:hypothetical protein